MEFRMKIAGQVGSVTPLFASTAQYFRAYLAEEKPSFFVSVQPEDLIFEQAELDEEARLEGFRRRQFTDPFLERAAIQRAFADHLLQFDTLLIHGSCVAVDGRAYLFTARSGTGKSTHTRLWREIFDDRAVMVNDDKPFLQLREGGVFACGSPWSGKHGLDANVTLPLEGICILERGSENHIQSISPEVALPMLLHQSYLPDENARLLTERLARSVPLWKMFCTKDPKAACVAYDAMHLQKAERR